MKYIKNDINFEKKVMYTMFTKYCASTITFEIIQKEDIMKEYQNFSEWLIYVCEEDKQQVNKKEMKYLKNTYDKLSISIREELSYEKQKENLKIIKRVNENARILRKYLQKVENEYIEYSALSCEDKDYLYYDNISQWYEIKKELTKRIIQNQKKKAREYLEIENTKKNLKYTNIQIELYDNFWGDKIPTSYLKTNEKSR